MALQLLKQDNQFQDFNYHKVGNININTVSNSCTFMIFSYKNADVKAFAQPNIGETYQIPINKALPVLDQCYAHLKTLPEWDGALDV